MSSITWLEFVFEKTWVWVKISYVEVSFLQLFKTQFFILYHIMPRYINISIKYILNQINIIPSRRDGICYDMNLHASLQEIIGCALQQNKNLKDHDQEIKEWLIVKKCHGTSLNRHLTLPQCMLEPRCHIIWPAEGLPGFWVSSPHSPSAWRNWSLYEASSPRPPAQEQWGPNL